MTASTTSRARREIGDHAVVLGGSMAGLVAARALSDHYRRVTLVEKDRFPDGPETRKGVPQIRHVHVLLKRGELVLARMFPGLLDEMLREGGHCIDMAADTRWHHYGGWKVRFRSGMDFHCQSRPFLEWKVRRRVAAIPNVDIADGCDALGLVVNAGKAEGLRIRDGGGVERTLDADLVVDASGRGSRTPQWLESHGYAKPPESRVTVDVGYASRLYRLPAIARSWKALFVYHQAPGTRLAVVVPVENDLWMVTQVGWFRDYPPGDDEGFLDFARSLPQPDVYEAIRNAEPCSPIVVHRFPYNLRRHYERLDRMPSGLVVFGDALCSFNPIYGQGMTSAALGAATLGEILADTTAAATESIGRRFHARFGRILDGVWMQTTSEDLRFAQAEGARAWWLGLANAYTAKVYERSRTDPVVSRAFLEVMHLMQPPTSLLRPGILRRVLLGSAPAQTPVEARYVDLAQ